MDGLKERLEEKGAKVNLQFTTRERKYMVYNDFMNTARAYGMQNDVDFFFSLAKDFIEDPDAKPLKVEKYFLSE